MVRTLVVAFAVAVPLSAQVRLAEMNRMLPAMREGAPLAGAGDVDGDGLPDLVFVRSRPFSGSIVAGDVWRAAGNSRFTAVAGVVPVSSGTVRSLHLADLDRDGDLDVVTALDAQCAFGGAACSNGGGEVLWNDGTGRFAARSPALPADPAARAQAVAVGDVDGDGDLDVVHACVPHTWSVMQGTQISHFRARGENLLLLNGGAGTFTAANARLGSDQDSSYAAVLADFDRDGDLDLFVGNAVTPNFGGGQDKLYRNDGAGNFALVPGALPTETEDAVSAFAFDADGDADQDLLVETRQGLRLRLNNGAGGFADATTNLPAVTPVNQLFLGDFDRDGAIDIGVRSERVLLQLRNNGAAVFARATAEDREVNLAQVVVLDAEGDLDLDLVTPPNGYSDSALFLNDGRGSWLPVRHRLPEIAANQLRAAAVDLDRDGDLDVVAPSSGSPSSVYVNDGLGGFQAVPYGDFTTDVRYANDIAAADFDGDGYVDVAVAAGLGQLYRNNGAGRLDRVATPPVDALSVAVGDVDGDGDPDLFFGGTAASSLLLNQGGGSFVVAVNAVSDPSAAADVALADLDGDGDLDAVAAGWFGQGNRVLRNNGAGGFTRAAGVLPNHSDDSRYVLPVDVDGDGDLDLVFANDGSGTPQANRLYRNGGAGVFTDSSQDLPGPIDRTLSYAAGDFDDDGDIDLLECNVFSAQPPRLLGNDGTGRFTEVAGGLPITPYGARSFVVADLDRDGDLDAFLVQQGPAHFYANLRRQLAWRELPRIGRPLTLEVFGRGGEPFAYVASLGRVDLLVPGLGRLFVDPATIAFSEVGALDASGRALRTYPVPANPALLGLRLHWQPLIGSNPQLGNLEITVLQRP